MAEMISVHEYVLKENVNPGEFEKAIQDARERGVLSLPGLVNFYFLKGVRGRRAGSYTAIWVYENKAVWEILWGPEGDPKPKENYPQNWKVWEDEILSPFLADAPDAIHFTSYKTF